jgi:hypothetical protein
MSGHVADNYVVGVQRDKLHEHKSKSRLGVSSARRRLSKFSEMTNVYYGRFQTPAIQTYRRKFIPQLWSSDLLLYICLK